MTVRIWQRNWGGECPVEPDTYVMVWQVNGTKKEGKAYQFDWSRLGRPEDIEWYRVPDGH